MMITVMAHPNSRKPRVETVAQDKLHVYVAEAPEGGKANKAVVKSLAVYYKVPLTRIVFLRGQKSKQKTFLIDSDYQKK